jgi:flagellar biosynthesis protein FlhF
MKIKRYTADSMRAALAQVRAEQGADAVILSSRRGAEGIEVIAAVDYDEALFVDANRQREAPRTAAPEPVPAPVPPPSKPAPAAKAPMPRGALAAPLSSPVIPPRILAAADGYGAMQRELQDLRRMLETGLAGMTWSDKRTREPLKARVLEELAAMDIAPDVAMALAARVPQRTSLANPSHIPLALLVKHLPVAPDLNSTNGGITAVIGPTGAGKTTTVAKIAARWCMQHGCQDLALVSTDCYRIGAREQLMTYARMLGVPMHAANNGRELARVLERLKAKKMIMIDTAGMGTRDVRLAEQLAALKLGAARAQVLLALPAQGDGHTLDEIVRAYSRANPAACVLTKTDETASLGAVISAVLRHRLKIAYVCDGQRVPENLHAGHRTRVWLVRTALRLKKLAPARSEAYLAQSFGRAPAHA